MREGMAWFCLKTQSKREKIAENYLSQCEEVDVFCPQIRLQKKTRNGKRWVQEFLFPGYLFARFDFQKHYRQVMHTWGVQSIIHFGDYYPSIDDAWIEELQQSMENENSCLLIPDQVMVGEKVEVVGAVFSGFWGTITHVASKAERVRVLLEFLGRRVEVDLSKNQIMSSAQSPQWGSE